MKIVNGSSKIDALQAIRGFAAIGVLMFHGTEMIHDKLGYLPMHNVAMVGFSGVDVFFVLSGFIILYTSFGKTSVSNFVVKRFIRIYPIYWVVTVLLIGLYFLSPSPEQAHKGDLGVILGSLSLFPQERYVVGVAWTLTYEVIFYLVFAVSYFKSPRAFFYTFSSWVAIVLIFYLFHIKTGIYAVDVFINPIVLEFSFGCLIAYLYRKFQYIRHYQWFLGCGITLLVLMWSYYYQLKLIDSDILNDDMSRVCFFGIPAGLIIFGALYSCMLVPKVLVYIVDASYSLYLMHGTILSLLIKIITKYNYAGIFSNMMGEISLFLATLFISCIFYSKVEKKVLAFSTYLLLGSKPIEMPVRLT